MKRGTPPNPIEQQVIDLKAGQDRILNNMRELQEEVRRVGWTIRDLIHGATLSMDVRRKLEVPGSSATLIS